MSAARRPERAAGGRRDLVYLWGAQFVSQLGDGMHASALPFLVYGLATSRTAAVAQLGIVATAATLPFLLFALAAGRLADHGDRRRVMIASDLARAGLLLIGLPLVVWSGLLAWPALTVLGFALGAAAAPFNPARDALVPELGAAGRLLRTNAVIQTTQQAALILGPALAGFYVGWRGDATVASERRALVEILVLDGLTFLISAVLVARIAPRLTRRTPASPDSTGVRQTLAWLKRDRFLAGLLVVTALDNFFIMGPAYVGASLFVKESLGLGAAHFSYFVAAMSVGWLVGALALMAWGDRWPRRRLLVAGIILDGLTYIPFAWIDELAVALIAIAAHGLAIPLITGVRTVIVQEHVAPADRGRAFALVNFTVIGCTALSQQATVVAAGFCSPPWLLAAAGAGGVLVGLFTPWLLRDCASSPERHIITGRAAATADDR